MKKILSEKYGLIQTTDVLFINHPSMIYADDKVIINIFETEKKLLSYVYSNIVVKQSLPKEPQEKIFYIDEGKIVVKIDSQIKIVDEKAIDDIKPIVK